MNLLADNFHMQLIIQVSMKVGDLFSVSRVYLCIVVSLFNPLIRTLL